MFEARMTVASLLKKIVEALKDLVTEGNFDVSASGISLQAMDSAHVALVALLLRANDFDHYRADRNLTLGINLGSLAKVLKCAGNDDILTLKAEDVADALTIMFESPKQDKISDFELKLMNITQDRIGIPDTDYEAEVTLPSTEFQRICRDLQILGDTVVITASKDGVAFKVSGELGTGNILLMQTKDVDAKPEEAIRINLKEKVELSFALKYLNSFTKATPLSPSVSLMMSNSVPLVVEYKIHPIGHLRFYLAPKMDDDEEAAE